MQQPRNLPQRQRGIALFISLVLLLVLTIIGVSSVQTTSLEVRMARNEHDAMLAFQAAESALRDAEAELLAAVSVAPYQPMADMGVADNLDDETIWTDGTTTVAPTAMVESALAPRYFIEYAGPVLRTENAYQLDDPYGNATVDRIEMFRVTALGVGGSANARVLLQTTFGRIMD
jgi:type IV pilus assembly protein PilX